MPIPGGWITISVTAYFLQAVAVVLDKFLLSGRIQQPSTYAFWVGIFGLGAFILLPFGFFVPDAAVIANAFISGIASTIGLLFFYKAIQRGEASRVAPIVGALSPLFTIFLSYVFLGEALEREELFALAVLIAGGLAASFPIRGARLFLFTERRRIVRHAIIAAFLFAVTLVFGKAVFNETAFINGFIWTRIGGFLGALLFIFLPQARSSIFAFPREASRSTVGAFFGNKGAGALGLFLLSFAVARAPAVSLVNALHGIQYAFIFLIAWFLSYRYPTILEEETTPSVLLEKGIAILLVATGLVMLAFFAR